MATATNKSNLMKPKSSSMNQLGQSSSSAAARPKPDSSSFIKKRVVESSTKHSVDVKQKSLTKIEVKGKTASASSSKTLTKTVTKTTGKKEKKVFSLAGQKFDPPEERDPLRIFYESLSKQIPSSEMAEFWLMEHGLLSPERSKRAFERKQRKQKQLRLGIPIKSPLAYSAPSRPESSKKLPQQLPKNGEVKAKKRIMNDSDDDDDDFVLSHKRRKG